MFMVHKMMIGRACLRKYRKRVHSHKESYRRYNSYDETIWKQVFFDARTGGFVVRKKQRILEGNVSEQARADLLKERISARRYASWGFQIEHLDEPKKQGGNPDARLRRRGPSARVNGILADFKQVDSPKKVYTRGIEALEQNAKLVLFHFTFPRSSKWWKSRLNHLIKEGVRGYYYFDGETRYYAL